MNPDLQEIQRLADGICYKYDYPKARIEMSSRLKKCWGLCFIQRKMIRLNKKFIELNSKEIVIDLLKHEICHLKHPNHGGGFVQACAEMGTKNHVWKQHPDTVRIKHKWILYCDACDYTYGFHNQTKTEYKCPHCGTRLKWRYNGNIWDRRNLEMPQVPIRN